MSPPKDSFRRRLFWSVLVIGAAALAIGVSAWYVAAYLGGVLACWFLYVHAIPPKSKKDSKS